MKSKDYLDVHELASLFGLTVQTLHYYDKAGVFKPDFRDPKNGYRKYRFDQVYELASIRYMRKLGYSIEAVRDFQADRKPDESLKKLKERSAAIHAQWEEQMRIDRAIMRKVQFIEESREEIPEDLDSFHITDRLERRFISIGSESEIYNGESFYFYPTIVFYDVDYKEFGALITDYEENKNEQETHAADESVHSRSIPGGRYLVGYHKGPYEEIDESFERLRRYAEQENMHNLDSMILTINIIDQFVESRNEEFITRLEVRIKTE